MCDVALDTIFCNGYGSCCSIINKDVRNTKIQAEADGAFGLTEKANLCIFEVRCFLPHLLYIGHVVLESMVEC